MILEQSLSGNKNITNLILCITINSICHQNKIIVCYLKMINGQMNVINNDTYVWTTNCFSISLVDRQIIQGVPQLIADVDFELQTNG